MTRVNFIVEGETEEIFVKRILTPHFASRNVFCQARRVETSRGRGKIHRGGMTTYQKAKSDVIRWLKEDKSAYLTTMFDVYALPKDFPKFSESAAMKTPREKVASLEQAFQEDINDARFIAYLQLHEFETLLFSDVEKIDNRLKIYAQFQSSQLNSLNRILDECGEPELIDEGESTAPSKRIEKPYPNYNKPLFGLLISLDIGLQTIRNKCPHFNAWIEKIEKLAQPCGAKSQ